MYIRSNSLTYTYQDFYHLASTMANTHSLLVSNFCYLTSILTNADNILNVNLFYLGSISTNTDDKPNNFTKKKLIPFKELFISYHQLGNTRKKINSIS